jgi:hypothetical protein
METFTQAQAFWLIFFLVTPILYFTGRLSISSYDNLMFGKHLATLALKKARDEADKGNLPEKHIKRHKFCARCGSPLKMLTWTITSYDGITGRPEIYEVAFGCANPFKHPDYYEAFSIVLNKEEVIGAARG